MATSDFPLAEPNILEKYTSYNYLFTLSALTKNEVNFPKETYKQGIPTENIIIKSGGGDPELRATLPGANRKFDFFIDNFNFETVFGSEAGPTPSSPIHFTVIEPYSIGLFLDALNEYSNRAARRAGADQIIGTSYLTSTYLLTIEFIGYDESGTAVAEPGATKHFTVELVEANMTFTGGGCRYEVSAIPHNERAFTDEYNKLYVDVTINGSTVQEMLQSGPQSLQNVLNKYLKEMVDATLPKSNAKITPDQYAIIFPKTSGGSEVQQLINAANRKNSATVNPYATDETTVVKKTGNSSGEATTIQSPGDVNEIGRSSFKIDMNTPGVVPIPEDNKAQPNGSKPVNRAKVTVSRNLRDFTFNKDSSVVNAIVQVLQSSEYCRKVADGLIPPNSRGMYTWFRIDSQVYILDSTDANLKVIGREPKLIVYSIIPFEVQSFKYLPPGSVPVGYNQIKKEVIKEYNYVYTGKNLDILQLEFKINAGYYQFSHPDRGVRNKESISFMRNSAGQNDQRPSQFQPSPGVLDNLSGTIQLAPNPTTISAGQGGGAGVNYDGSRARAFHEIYMNESVDQVMLDLTIMGDPYYVNQSAIGNFNNQDTSVFNKTADGSINYQTGEVDIHIKFSVPYDIGPDGYADFGGGTSGSFNGLYRIIRVVSKFQQGKFTQELSLLRRGGQTLERETGPGGTIDNGFDAITEFLNGFFDF